MTDVAEITRDVAALVRAPRRVSVVDCASESMRIKLASGSEGPWDPTRTPYMIEPANMLKSRAFEAVVFVGAARSGKTLILCDGWIVHAILADPGDFGAYVSTQPLAHDWRKRRLEYQHRHSPAVKAKLSPRLHDTNIEFVQYRHGMILNLGWPSSSQLAQRDLRYVALSDYDSFPDDIGGEGSGFDLARKRIQVAGSAGMCLVESSPKRAITTNDWTFDGPHQAPPVDGGILPLYNRGDRRRWYWQCVEGCGDWFEAPALPAYDDAQDIAEAAESAHVACPTCGQVYRPTDKDRLNQSSKGVWVPEGCSRDVDGNLIGKPRASKIASFWMMGSAAAFQSWPSLVLNHLQAQREFDSTGDERALKTTRNVDQGVPHQPAAMRKARNASFLTGRLESWERYFVPPGVRFLVAVVDNQSDRWEVRVWGYGVGRERWLIDGYAIREIDGAKVRPASYQEHWAELTKRVVLSTYRIDADRELRVWRVAVDAGGHAEDEDSQTTRQAYDWWRSIARDGLGHRVRLVKGRDNAQTAVRETFPDSRKRANRKARSVGDVPVLELGSTTLKDSAWSDLLRESPGPGYVHLPTWAPGEYLDELVSETRGPKRWEISHGKRNETWDTLYYADAVCLFYGADRIDWGAPPPWASNDWANNPEVITPDQRRDLKSSGGVVARRKSSWQ